MPPLRIAINGFGRIGRHVLRACFEAHRQKEIQIIAINDLSPPDLCAHLIHYDSTHGPFPGTVEVHDNTLEIAGQTIQLFATRDPATLPWKDLGIDIVFECTGAFTERSKAAIHLESGARGVLISAPGKNVDATIVYGVNEGILNSKHQVISNASCTTNCLAPIAKIIHNKVGIAQGLMNTIHAVTNDQVLLDVRHSDYRRARSAMASIIPTKTGAAQAVSLVLPELAGRLDGFSMRVPVMNVSAVDFTFKTERSADMNTLHEWMKEASEGSLKGVLAYNTLPLVSIDFNHHPASAIFDATQTKQIGDLFKIVAWYDNEWGFSNRMLDTALAWQRAWG